MNNLFFSFNTKIYIFSFSELDIILNIFPGKSLIVKNSKFFKLNKIKLFSVDAIKRDALLSYKPFMKLKVINFFENIIL